MSSSLFQILDFDRTLFDTSAFTKALTDEIDRTEPGMGAELDRQFEEAYSREETFFILRHLRSEKGDAWFEALVERVVAQKGAESLMLPGARERLAFADTLATAHPAWGILTYGDEIDQLMKLRIAGLQDAPLVIADTPDKGAIIASWQKSDGTFKLPDAFGGAVVERLTFEDDKLRAFVGLPENTHGIWITQFADATERINQAGLAGVVVPAAGLAESSALIVAD